MTAMEQWSWPPSYDDRTIPPTDQVYWFPQRETMPAAEREDAILHRIRQVMAYAYERSTFYRRKWSDAGIHPESVRSLEDFEQVPVITKEELRAEQAAHEPFGDYLCVPPEDVFRIHGTSGTTGRPTAFGISRGDWRAIANAHARVMWGMGIRPSDTVVIGSFFSLYMGSWGALIGAERMQAKVFPFGAGVPGQTARAVHWMRQMKPTVFYGTPSYALRLVEVAQEEGVDPKNLGLRLLFFSGEPGGSVPSVRARIQDSYGAQVFDSGSMAEMSPWMNLGESTGRSGMLCWQDIVYTEVVDPETHLRVSYGREGTPVYTHLERLSQPMIRLLSGDLTRWDSGPSPCGRTYPILPHGIYGRIDDMFTVRGENVYPSSIDDVVSRLPNYGGEHRILISREDAMDRLIVQVEYDRPLLADDDGKVAAFKMAAEHALRTVLGVAALVVPVPRGTFDRAELKSRRVVDDRNLLREALQAAQRGC